MMTSLREGVQNVLENDGLLVAATGMSIVFIALTTIALFIAVLPRLLGVVDRLAGRARTARAKPEEAAVVAAIGAALHDERQRGR